MRAGSRSKLYVDLIDGIPRRDLPSYGGDTTIRGARCAATVKGTLALEEQEADQGRLIPMGRPSASMMYACADQIPRVTQDSLDGSPWEPPKH